ncbi:putative disease resistance protein RGA3 [Durio zibethinus]|uniref:Disease resistance protein RGA3 n=1 Tax=Durio zibethinus TaxID=66656 RepID=A0A6P6AH54_DURZI|nr:putative disease resistance protein RGA3 [Durio zibethinus]
MQVRKNQKIYIPIVHKSDFQMIFLIGSNDTQCWFRFQVTEACAFADAKEESMEGKKLRICTNARLLFLIRSFIIQFCTEFLSRPEIKTFSPPLSAVVSTSEILNGSCVSRMFILNAFILFHEGYCESLEKLPNTLHNFTSLQELQIENCPKLISFSEINLPFTLKKLVISNHNKLQYFLDGESINTNDFLLEHLEIASCPSLISLSSRHELPFNLQHLKIKDCSKLASLSSSGKLPIGHKHLTIRNCPELESIGQEFYNNILLEFIYISWCRNVKHFPQGLDKLINLQAIVIEYCPSLISFPTSGSPNTNHKVLCIYKCEELRGLPKYIHNLTSLQELEISNYPPLQGFWFLATFF